MIGLVNIRASDKDLARNDAISDLVVNILYLIILRRLDEVIKCKSESSTAYVNLVVLLLRTCSLKGFGTNNRTKTSKPTSKYLDIIFVTV